MRPMEPMDCSPLTGHPAARVFHEQALFDLAYGDDTAFLRSFHKEVNACGKCVQRCAAPPFCCCCCAASPGCTAVNSLPPLPPGRWSRPHMPPRTASCPPGRCEGQPVGSRQQAHRRLHHAGGCPGIHQAPGGQGCDGCGGGAAAGGTAWRGLAADLAAGARHAGGRAVCDRGGAHVHGCGRRLLQGGQGARGGWCLAGEI